MDPIQPVFESEPSITKTIHLQMEQKTLEHEHTRGQETGKGMEKLLLNSW